MAKRKKVRNMWKAQRKVQLAKNRRAKAIRLSRKSGLKAGSGSGGK